MHVIMDEKRNATEFSEESPQTPVHPGSETLRRAVRRNIVSFPSQIPTLLKRPPADTQWRIVLLFFVCGWSSGRIAARFNVPRHRIWKILNGWSVRALALGYVQVIDPEAFAACCRVEVEYGSIHDEEEIESAPAPWSPPLHLPNAVPAVVANSLEAPAEGQPGNNPVDVPGTSGDVLAALDAAIAHCETWRDEFWVRTATLLRELRTLAAALELRRSSERADELFAALQHGQGSLPNGLRVREEERVSHAVA
jgi:hypothetical protein